MWLDPTPGCPLTATLIGFTATVALLRIAALFGTLDFRRVITWLRQSFVVYHNAGYYTSVTKSCHRRTNDTASPFAERTGLRLETNQLNE
jgi:hypothetical protein